MTVMSRLTARLAALSALAACALPLAAIAQPIGSGGSPGGGGSSEAAAPSDGASSRANRGSGARRTRVEPYIEASQIVTAELSPGDDVLTYSVIAAGVDAEVVGLNSAASVSLRYEHRFGWGRRAEDGDILSGIARGYTTVAPGVRIEAGGLAARMRIEDSGASIVGPLRNDDRATQIYSVFAGPSVATQAGDVTITGNYRLGYTRIEEPNAFAIAPGAPAVDVFDESTVHFADVRAGIAPYEVLPVGLGVGAQYFREDVSFLDQRIEDFRARADVTIPVSPTLAFVAGVGYENVRISGRDALRDGAGNPLFGPDGRPLTDGGGPRVIAYDVDGLIWDAGVMWRPSRRTSLEAYVGRRYGTTSFWGTFAYTPNERSSINVAVYDNIAGFGGQVNRALADMPAEFSAIRNPLTGDIGGCVATLEGNGCLANVLGSVRSSTFRARGVIATYALQLGRISTGFGAGYDRRRFIAAPGTLLATYNGVLDENYWLAAYLGTEIDARSNLTANVFANWFKNGIGGDTSAVGAVAAYRRSLTGRLSAIAALGIDGINEEPPLQDFWTASALLGLRYSF